MRTTFTMYEATDKTLTTEQNGSKIANHDTRKQAEEYLRSIGATEYFFDSETKDGDEEYSLIDLFCRD